MAKTIKSNNLTGALAAQLFAAMNKQYVELIKQEFDGRPALRTQLKPTDERLIYPYGWYYAKGTFRNKHQSDSGIYDEIQMKCWDDNEDVVLPDQMEETINIW